VATDSPERTADHETATPWDWLLIYLKGLAMGTADAVPGVSGGTIALITGIYERLIHALTTLDPGAAKHIPTLYREQSRTEFRNAISEMDLGFLVVLGTGMVSAVVLLARVVQFALSSARGPTFAFFFGLIGASAIILGRRHWLRSPPHLGAILLGGSLAFLIAGASGQGIVPHSLPVVFFAGMVAISGMVLPGISGAFILLLLGQYDPMTASLNGFVDGLLAFGSNGITAELVEHSTIVAVFISGAFVGLFTVAFGVRWALERHRTVTLAFLVALMIGALRLPVIEIAGATDGVEPTEIASLVLAALVGALAILLLDRQTDDLDY